MDIQPIRQVNFKGYDARPLKGFIMSSNNRGIADAMQKIGLKEGFEIYTAVIYENLFKGISNNRNIKTYPWAQDYWTIFKNKLLVNEYNKTTESIREFFGLKEDFTERITLNNCRKILKEKIKENNIRYKRAEKENDEEKIGKYYWEGIKLGEEYEHPKFHIPGGNIFIVKGDNKKDEIIIGKKSLDIYDIDEIKGMYETEKVTVLPRMDFHLDLFIRPLDNKRILLTDDNMTLEVLKNNLQKIKDYTLALPYRATKKQYELERIIMNYQEAIDSFDKHKTSNRLAQADEVESILKENGYEVIRVPGRIYKTGHYLASDEQLLKHDCNYMNANVLINKDGELVYIPNSSNFDSELGITPELAKEIGCSFEEAFIKSTSPYVKREHIYFVKGDDNYVETTLLKEFGGGIHCACAEIPNDLGNVL